MNCVLLQHLKFSLGQNRATAVGKIKPHRAIRLRCEGKFTEACLLPAVQRLSKSVLKQTGVGERLGLPAQRNAALALLFGLPQYTQARREG